MSLPIAKFSQINNPIFICKIKYGTNLFDNIKIIIITIQ